MTWFGQEAMLAKARVYRGPLRGWHCRILITAAGPSQLKEAEHEALTAAMRDNGAEDGDRVVRAVMGARHAREADDLEARYAAERKVTVEDVLSRAADTHERRRSEVLGRHADEMAALQVGRSDTIIWGLP